MMPNYTQLENKIVELQNTNDALAEECCEQARLNGMGAERELALWAEIDRLRAALHLARQYMPMGAEIYDADIQHAVDFVEATLGGKVKDGS